MSLLIGTNDGVFRVGGIPFDDAERVLDCGRVLRVRRFDGVDGAFVTSHTGLYWFRDEHGWENLAVPQTEVYSAVASPDGERLYAGTHPAHLYVANIDELEPDSPWRELTGFRDLPSRPTWSTPRHRNEAHVRSLGMHPDAPDRIVAGVEVGGVHVSEDSGETWTERREGVHADVHHVLVTGPEAYVASCGGGLYRTEDAGQSWTRLDRDLDHSYFREAFAHEGTLYAAAARRSPPSWGGEHGTDAALFESQDDGNTFERVSYPGEPEEFVLAWAAVDGRVVAGTNEGRVIGRTDDGWETLGSVPNGIPSLAAV